MFQVFIALLSIFTLTPMALMASTAQTVSYEGEFTGEAGDHYRVTASLRYDSQYRSSKISVEEYEAFDPDITIEKPFICTTTVEFSGPQLQMDIVQLKTGKNVFTLSEVIELRAQRERSFEETGHCRLPESMEGFSGPLKAYSSGVRIHPVGQYKNSPLWAAIPSLQSWEGVGRLVATVRGYELENFKLTSDHPTKTGWLSYQPDPKLNYTNDFGEFEVVRKP